MSVRELHEWSFLATLEHPHSYKSKWKKDDRLNDGLYTSDGLRIWARLTGEQPQLNEHPNLQEEPFLIVGFIGIEDDTSYTSYQLTASGKVIREVHQSTRTNDMLGPVTEEARFCDEEEINQLLTIIAPVIERT